MKKLFSFLILTIICLTSIKSQYCNYTIYLTSQAAVDNFSNNYNCDSFNVIIISSHDTLELDSMYNISFIQDLRIECEISSFQGFDNIGSIQRAYLYDIEMSEFNGFPAWAVKDRLEIRDCDFVSLDFLDSLRTLNIIYLYNLDELVDLSGLENLDSVGTITMYFLNRIKELEFPGLTYLRALETHQCDSLQKILNLGAANISRFYSSRCDFQDTLTLPFTNIGNSIQLSVHNMASLTFINTPQLVECDYFYVGNCPELLGIHNNLFSSSAGTRAFQLSDNPKLKHLLIPNINQSLAIEDLYLNNCDSLDVDIFQQLRYCENLNVYEMPIESWPFKNLVHCRALYLYNNPYLTMCCDLFHQINSQVYSELYMGNNGSGCNHYIEMMQYCGTNTDADQDGILDSLDNCPNFINIDQTDSDGDGVGDECDNCPYTINAHQIDVNNNGIGDVCEPIGFDVQFEVYNGDTYLDSPSGLVLKDVNGSCYRLQMVNGELKTSMIACP